MTKLILVRHGETDTNTSGKMHLPNDNVPLNANGRSQIEAVGKIIKELKVTRIYSSNETRAIESAQILANYLKLKVKTVNGLQERDWGKLAGQPWSEVELMLNKLDLAARYAYKPPNGESWQNFELRLVAAIKFIIDQNPGEVIVVVTHGGAIRALISALQHIPKEESFKYNPGNGSITVFEIINNTYKIVPTF